MALISLFGCCITLVSADSMKTLNLLNDCQSFDESSVLNRLMINFCKVSVACLWSLKLMMFANSLNVQRFLIRTNTIQSAIMCLCDLRTRLYLYRKMQIAMYALKGLYWFRLKRARSSSSFICIYLVI